MNCSTVVEEIRVVKVGKPPLTYYKYKEPEETHVSIHIPKVQQLFLHQHFLWISEIGERFEGLEAMIRWCRRQKLPVEKTIDEFILTRKKYRNDALLLSGHCCGLVGALL